MTEHPESRIDSFATRVLAHASSVSGGTIGKILERQLRDRDSGSIGVLP